MTKEAEVRKIAEVLWACDSKVSFDFLPIEMKEELLFKANSLFNKGIRSASGFMVEVTKNDRINIDGQSAYYREIIPRIYEEEDEA